MKVFSLSEDAMWASYGRFLLTSSSTFFNIHSKIFSIVQHQIDQNIDIENKVEKSWEEKEVFISSFNWSSYVIMVLFLKHTFYRWKFFVIMTFLQFKRCKLRFDPFILNNTETWKWRVKIFAKSWENFNAQRKENSQKDFPSHTDFEPWNCSI